MGTQGGRGRPTEREVCPICGASFDPAVLDELRYHANDPHGPILGTGIIGEQVDDRRRDESSGEKNP